ncbi:sigma 54-interacting transcriptional regulator [Desulfitobacterium sp.]|uniref:sigma 54-interacting transcriptional regulator n=1 Tax=Desulfitobacterium sp. TaxID=49981 RepID=UPI002B212AA6|nr:sigma 54-interacting transcriptional regulator [Desulfitobacterium sp.]MEA4903208.1 sigma 54-interacting transcriptional regulator [Desulfitobacterium sp.]
MQQESILRILPILAKTTGGYATITDRKGRRLYTFDFNGNEVESLKGKVYELAQRAVAEGQPLLGSSQIVDQADAWALPLDDYVLSCSNIERFKREQKFQDALRRALPMIAQVAGGEAVLFNERGERIVSYNPDGTENKRFKGKMSKHAHKAMQIEEPVIAKSFSVNGAMAVRIPMNDKFGFGFNNENVTNKHQKLYEEGAFTGAKKGGSPGIFEQANGGTVFLDEISEMELGLQTKLLRVLQEREVVRIGGFKSLKVDVRVIASTNKDLNKLIAEGKFRKDLYYRLNVVQIKIPGLRERNEDIPILAKYFVEKYNACFGKFIEEIDSKTMHVLQNYSWPGNVRELQNCIEHAMNMVGRDESVLLTRHIPLGIQKGEISGNEPSSVKIQPEDLNLNEAIRETEKKVIQKALQVSKYKKNKAAKLLGISTSTLWRHLTELGLEEELK